MADSITSKKPTCYIEFRIFDEQRYTILLRFFDVLKSATRKEAESIEGNTTEATFRARNYTKPEDYLLVFRPPDLELMKMPTHAESISALRRWRDLSRKERRNDINKNDALQSLAEFHDMIQQFSDIDYELVKCEKISSDLARLHMTTEGFAVTTAVEELLLFFGFFSHTDKTC